MFQMTLILIIMKIELKNKPKALFMLRFIIILLICFLPIQISLAKKPNETHPWAIVETLQGKATFNKKALKVNDMIRNKGVIKELNIFNASNIDIPVEENDIIIFPSKTLHGTQSNKTNDERISISGDVVCVSKNSELLETIMPPINNWDKM